MLWQQETFIKFKLAPLVHVKARLNNLVCFVNKIEANYYLLSIIKVIKWALDLNNEDWTSSGCWIDFWT